MPFKLILQVVAAGVTEESMQDVPSSFGAQFPIDFTGMDQDFYDVDTCIKMKSVV